MNFLLIFGIKKQKRNTKNQNKFPKNTRERKMTIPKQNRNNVK